MTDRNDDAIFTAEELTADLTPADDGCIATAAGRYHEYPALPDRDCGVRICYDCRMHQGLARCFCGWAIDGGSGRAQLEEMGENLEPLGAEWDF